MPLKLQGKHVFLTGATGFIGLPLTQALLRRGWQVTALVRTPKSARSRSIQALCASLACGDILDRASMRAPMTYADVVINNAGWYEYGVTRAACARMTAVNVQGADNVIGLAAELGVSRIIHVSSIVAYGRTGEIVADETFQRQHPPASHYERTKAEAHAIATTYQQLGIPVIIVCPAGVIGPGEHSGLGYLVRMYVHGWFPPIAFGASGRRAHVYVDDCAEAIALTAEKGHAGEIYILSNGNMQHRDMFMGWTCTPGGFKPRLWLPNRVAMALCTVAEPVQRLFRLPMVFCREFATAVFSNWQFSAAKAERELGMQFRSLEQAWLDTLNGERAIA